MSRAQRRMYRRARGQAIRRRVLLAATLAVIAIGFASHLGQRDGFSAQPLAQPTATPVTAAFDETVTAREVVLPADVWYAIQTGVYSTQEAAQARADAYADRGAPGYVAEDGGKWRVFIACYGDKADASAVRERLSTLQQVDTHLHEWSAQAVTLRLSGMAGQLDVAEAGLTLPVQAAAQLRDSAIALDAGEMTAEGARQAVEALGERMALWAQTARERFAMPYPAVISTVLSFAQNWPEQQRDILDTQDVTALSARMKQTAMALRDWDCALRVQLMQ